MATAQGCLRDEGVGESSRAPPDVSNHYQPHWGASWSQVLLATTWLIYFLTSIPLPFAAPLQAP